MAARHARHCVVADRDGVHPQSRVPIGVVLDVGLAFLVASNYGIAVAAFIAPEQALGGASFDHRADLYATGCVAYWLLTGELVFTAETTMGVIMHHVHTAPVPPSQRTELAIPRALEELVLSCLAKDPADRPRSARDLSRRLAALPGAERWDDERAREWWATHEPAALRRAEAAQV